MCHLHPRRFLTLFAFLLPFLASQPLAAISPPDNSTTRQVSLRDRIHARMSDVDDIGLVLVWNGLGARTVLECEWKSGGKHGADSGELGPYLTVGDNYIIFVLYNKEYSGLPFIPAGKWSYDFSLSKNGHTFWRSSNFVRENDPEIKYWKVFKASVSGDGNVAISDTVPAEMMPTLHEAMLELEEKLQASAGVATPF